MKQKLYHCAALVSTDSIAQCFSMVLFAVSEYEAIGKVIAINSPRFPSEKGWSPLQVTADEVSASIIVEAYKLLGES